MRFSWEVNQGHRASTRTQLLQIVTRCRFHKWCFCAASQMKRFRNMSFSHCFRHQQMSFRKVELILYLIASTAAQLMKLVVKERCHGLYSGASQMTDHCKLRTWEKQHIKSVLSYQHQVLDTDHKDKTRILRPMFSTEAKWDFHEN